jgi:hypothetical protein
MNITKYTNHFTTINEYSSLTAYKLLIINCSTINNQFLVKLSNVHTDTVYNLTQTAVTSHILDYLQSNTNSNDKSYRLLYQLI